jgi:DNA-binding transcriptional LysR family regulator
VKLDVHSLRLFVTVAEHLHFGRAARALSMSQPPLSQQIQRLEQRLGGRLFERTNRRVRLTALGEAILADSRDVLGRMDTLERHVDRIVRGAEGRLRVGYVSPALDLVAQALGAVRRAHPQLEITLSRLSTADQLESIRNGTLDVGVARLFRHDVSDLNARRIWTERYVLAVSSDDPLAHKPFVALKDLAGRSFLAFERATQPTLYDFIVATCAGVGVELQITQRLETKREIVALAGAGLGVGLVPESSKSDAPRGVTFVPVRGELPAVELWAVTPLATSAWAARFIEAFVAKEPSAARPRRQRAGDARSRRAATAHR